MQALWYLVVISYGITYSPPMQTLAECERVQKAVLETAQAPYKTFTRV